MSPVHVLNDAQKLREEYFSDLSVAKSADADNAPSGTATVGTEAKAKPKLKKKAGDDPFASDDEQPEEPKPVARKAENPKKPPPKTAKVSSKDGFASDDQTEADSDEEARKAEVAAKKAAAKRKPVSSVRSKRPEDEDDDEVEERPKKKRGRK